ncbi:MAG: type II/IV secretion system ATPase subunit [Candidatus Aenigmatarchaeota archaeon]
MVIGKKILLGAKRFWETQTPIILTRMQAEIEAKMRAKIKKLEAKLGLRKPKTKKPWEEFPGIEIPYYPFEFLEEEERKEGIVEEYPLNVKNGKVFAFVRITFENGRYIYNVIEPELSEEEKRILKEIKEKTFVLLGEKFELPYEEEVSNIFNRLIENYNLSQEQKEKLWYYVERDLIGYGIIDALMRDPNIEDISCDGLSIPIFVVHKNPLLGSIQTNIVINNREELDSLVIRLAQKCGKVINLAQPLVDGILPDGSRLQATLETDIAIRGSNFTIRKFPKKVLTPIDLIRSKTIDALSLAYLWFCIDYGRNVLISGGTGTGKTTLLNVISSFIRYEKKIVSIEDTPEIKLPHTHWVQHVARVSVSSGKEGEVDLFELIRAALRQRPDYIIVGEVRGVEANVLFQGMATGHTGLATIHAEDMTKLIDRLKTKPIELSPSLIEILDLVVFVKRLYYKDKITRRVSNIVEILAADEKEVKYRDVITWNPFNDKFEIVSKSYTLYKISKSFGLDEDEIKEEILNRAKVLDFMYKYDIRDLETFHQVITLYHTNKEGLLSYIEELLI